MYTDVILTILDRPDHCDVVVHQRTYVRGVGRRREILRVSMGPFDAQETIAGRLRAMADAIELRQASSS